MRKAILALAVVAMCTIPEAVEAQFRTGRAPAAFLGLNFVAAEAVGNFAHYVDDGYGGELWGRMPVDDEGWISLRGDVGVVVYGYERDPVCMSSPIGCRIQFDLKTTNNIVYGGVGPELAIPGQKVRPYVNAQVGFSYLFTTSSLDDDWGDDVGTTHHLGDGVLSSKFGGGVELRMKRGRVPMYLDFGVRYHHNGIAEFLTKGDIVDHPNGDITIYPNRDETDILTYRVGLTIGIPRGDDGRRGRRR